MENGKKWRFKGGQSLSIKSNLTVRRVLDMLKLNLNPDDPRQVLGLAHGDPSHFPSFFTSPSAEVAIVDALQSRQFNCYGSSNGLFAARKVLSCFEPSEFSIAIHVEIAANDMVGNCYVNANGYSREEGGIEELGVGGSVFYQKFNKTTTILAFPKKAYSL